MWASIQRVVACLPRRDLGDSMAELGGSAAESVRPDSRELNRAFAHLIKELDLPPDKQTELMAQSDDNKWMLLQEKNVLQVRKCLFFAKIY